MISAATPSPIRSAAPVEGFLDKHAYQELHARGDVLQEAGDRERGQLGGRGEEQERDGGDEARADEQDVDEQALTRESARAVDADDKQVAGCLGIQDASLEREPVDGLSGRSARRTIQARR
jgi:hypothetical protein